MTLPDPSPTWPVRAFADLHAELEAQTPSAGAAASRWYPAADPDAPVLVWIHGGGYVGGTLDMPESEAVGRGLTERGVAALALGYRKALHGVRYPAPVDDVERGWRDALTRTPRPFLAGASAGGGLALSLALRLRGTADAPRGLALLYPTLHADLPRDPDLEALMAPVAAHRRFPRDFVRAMHENFAGTAVDDAAATPGLDHGAGLPPLLVITSEFDDLRASGAAFARTAEAAGGDVRYVVEPGTYHGHLNEPARPGFGATLDRLADWMLRA
jgi:acetyl esterase